MRAGASNVRHVRGKSKEDPPRRNGRYTGDTMSGYAPGSNVPPSFPSAPDGELRNRNVCFAEFPRRYRLTTYALCLLLFSSSSRVIKIHTRSAATGKRLVLKRLYSQTTYVTLRAKTRRRREIWPPGRGELRRTHRVTPSNILQLSD